MANGRILIIEDDQDLLSVLDSFLTSKRFEVYTVTSGEEGVARLLGVRPHIILLDLHLPGMDGIDTLKKIRETDSAVGVLVMTAFDDQLMGQRALELGACDYIRKPIDFKYLETTVTRKITSMTGNRD